MSKNLKNGWKTMKIANIDREIIHIFWMTLGISMKLSGKLCLMIILKVTKKPGFYPPFRRYIFRKTTGGRGSNWPLPAVLGLMYYQIEHLSFLQIIYLDWLKVWKTLRKLIWKVSDTWKYALKWKRYLNRCSLYFWCHRNMSWQHDYIDKRQFLSHVFTKMFLLALWNLKKAAIVCWTVKASCIESVNFIKIVFISVHVRSKRDP